MDDLIDDDAEDRKRRDCLAKEYEMERKIDAAENQPPDHATLALEWGGIEGYRDANEKAMAIRHRDRKRKSAIHKAAIRAHS